MNTSSQTQSGGNPALTPLAFATLLSGPLIAIYAILWSFAGPDLSVFLFPWIDHIRLHGAVGAFAIPFSNYSPPYLYLLAAGAAVTSSNLAIVKALSILSAVCIALAVLRLLRGTEGRTQAALFVLLLPTVVINGIFYGQCDGFWVAASIMAVSSDLEDRPGRMALWAGIAFAFKAQAAFVAPYVIGRLICRREPVWVWLIPAATWAVANLPALAAGWPASDLATVYLRQAQYSNAIGNAPSPWAIVATLAPHTPVSFFWIGYVASATAAGIVILASAVRGRPGTALIALAAVSAIILPFLLPKMHERYLFLGDVLTFALAVRTKSGMVIAAATFQQVASLLAHLSYMTAMIWFAAIGAPFTFTGLMLLVLYLRACERAATGQSRTAEATARAPL